MSEQDDATDQRPRDRRRLWLAVGVGVGAAAVAVAVAITAATVAPAGPATAGTTAPTTSSSAAQTTTTSAAPVRKSPAPETTPTVDADPEALADLRSVAAGLTPVVLTSPSAWDRWLPQGKPYPGPSTEEDIATCPILSERLGAALGTKMSYWTGTLPKGPFGCTWATVPLYSGPDAPNYPYLANVGFVSDGTTTEQLSGSFYHHEGRLCPSTAVPAVGGGAYLVRCEELDGISYALVLRDTRTSGIWVLYGMARADAAHPAIDVFRPVLDGVVSAFG